MKKQLLLPIGLICLLLVLNVACEKEEEEVCERFSTPTCQIDATFCSDGGDSYYEYEGQKYACNGDNCDQAIDDIIEAAGCSVSAIQLKSGGLTQDQLYMLEISQSVIAEAKALNN
jgi:hypothetical protein